MMLHRLWVGLLSLSLALPSFAGHGKISVEDVNSFLKDTEISSRSVSWQDFYKKIGPSLPSEVQREMQYFIQQHPGAKIPKVQVTRLDQGPEQSVQLVFLVKGEKVFLTLNLGQGAKFAQLEGKQNGVKVSSQINLLDLENPVGFISHLSGTQTLTQKAPGVQVLSMEDVKNLGSQEKARYVDRFRAALEAAELVQNSMNSSGQGSSSAHRYFLQKLVSFAYAGGPTGDCIVAGWAGSYVKGSCQPPPESEDQASGTIRCNPAVYGDSIVVGRLGQKLPLDATASCNRQTEANKYSVFRGVKSTEEVNAKKSSLSKVLTGLREKCAGINTQTGAKLDDQPPTCMALTARLDELDRANCAILEASQSKAKSFPNLKCLVSTGAGVATVPPNTPDSQAGDCVNLPENPSGLKCLSSQVKQITCPVDGAGKVSRFYCQCEPAEIAELKNTSKAVACVPAKPISGNTAGRTGGVGSERTKPARTESWFKPWMGVALAGAVGLGIWYWGTKKTIASVYAPYTTTTTTATPVPPPTAPAPVDVNRSTPTGTR